MDRDVGGQTTINLLRRFRGALSPICNHYKHMNELGGTESWNLQSTSCRHHAMGSDGMGPGQDFIYICVLSNLPGDDKKQRVDQ